MAMEFWGVEVKVGQTVTVEPKDPYDASIHLSQVALGEAKKDRASEPVVLYLKVGDQKFVLGTLSRDDIPQISLDLALDTKFELSHNSKIASVYFCGYKFFDGISDKDNVYDLSDSDEDLPWNSQDNGKPETKAKEAKVTESRKPVVELGASAKQVKIVDPKKDEEDESDDESDDEDEFGSSDEMDADSDSDEESDEDEDGDDEETPAKKTSQAQVKKRPNESASKTPVPTKKAKNATPEKTDGKKIVHTATPHPMKKGGKTSNSVGKDQTPNSGGQLSCKSCNKSFTSESGLEQHKKAKHGGQ